MFIRLFWLAVFEPQGAKRAAAKTQQMGELAQYASTTILISIIIYSLMRKRWAYLAGSIFGLVHFTLISLLVIMHVSPGRGFLVVIPSSLGMMIFSFLSYRKH
jgi:hypothetical protein